MDFVSSALITLTQPSGFWPSILNAFKGATGTYIVAVILIAIIIRVLLSVVDVINKKVSAKSNGVMAKMKPELDAIQKKYGHDPKLMSQKQNEVYRKYQFNMMGSCLPMLISLVLQMVVFLTLWNSLQSMANFNVVEKYENMKNIYANVIALNDNTGVYTSGEIQKISIDKEKIYILTDTVETEIDYKENFSNEEVFNNLITKYVNSSTENTEYAGNSISEALVVEAQKLVEEYYNESQEGFLWIKNIYRSESPTSPIFSKDEVKKYMSGFYSEEEKTLEKNKDYEGKIFDYVVTNTFDGKDLGRNGYYILTIIAVAASFFSMWLSNRLMRNKNAPAQKSNMMMYFILPIIMGIFTFMYTSLFAIYIITGQLVMIALTPLTTFIVKKWNSHDEKKNHDKNVIEVDYRRKDI